MQGFSTGLVYFKGSNYHISKNDSFWYIQNMGVLEPLVLVGHIGEKIINAQTR